MVKAVREERQFKPVSIILETEEEYTFFRKFLSRLSPAAAAEIAGIPCPQDGRGEWFIHNLHEEVHKL